MWKIELHFSKVREKDFKISVSDNKFFSISIRFSHIFGAGVKWTCSKWTQLEEIVKYYSDVLSAALVDIAENFKHFEAINLEKYVFIEVASGMIWLIASSRKLQKLNFRYKCFS